MTTIKFELGKFYRTRNGLKAQIFMLDNGKGIMLCAYFFHGAWLELALLKTGKLHEGTHEHNLDIVGEWREPIERRTTAYVQWCEPLTDDVYSHLVRLGILDISHVKSYDIPHKVEIIVRELPDDSH